MRISELFHSIQGEGKLMGAPSTFVRVSGCNLRCTWCDTPYASWDPEGPDMTVSQIVDAVQTFGAKHVVLTGGEPIIMPEIEELVVELRLRGHHLTLETAGTVFKPLDVQLVSISPKLSNSTPTTRAGGRFALLHDQQRDRPDVVRALVDHVRSLGFEHQLKFVVEHEHDLREIEAFVARVGSIERWDVLLMPEGTDVQTLRERMVWLEALCRREGYRLCPRLHVELYGNKRGT